MKKEGDDQTKKLQNAKKGLMKRLQCSKLQSIAM